MVEELWDDVPEHTSHLPSIVPQGKRQSCTRECHLSASGPEAVKPVEPRVPRPLNPQLAMTAITRITIPTLASQAGRHQGDRLLAEAPVILHLRDPIQYRKHLEGLTVNAT